MEGVRSFLRSRRKLLERESTFVLAIDSVGAGAVRWIEAEGPAVSYPMDSRLIELCAAVAEADPDANAEHPAAPLRHGFASDALAARAAGWHAGAITCLEPGALLPANAHTTADLPEAIDPAALDRAEQFAHEVIRALDRDVGRASATPTRPVAATTA
jgi:hypothetical protein